MVYEFQFVKGKFYKAGIGKTHLESLLRDRYDESRIPEPNIRIRKYDQVFVEASKDELYNLYDFCLKNRQRKNANVYFEYMVSGYEPNKTVDIAEYLHKMFEGRPIFAIEHFDTKNYHTYFVVFSKDWEHPKSPNLKKKDLHQLRVDMGRITGQKVKERGAGLQKHVGLYSNPEWTKALVEDQEREAKQMKQIQEQIKPLIDLYGAIEIFSISSKKGLTHSIYNGTGRTVFTNVDQLPMRKLIQLDFVSEESLAFKPVLDEQNRVKGVFLDDVPKKYLDYLPNGTIVVGKSPHGYQAHIPLPEPYLKNEADNMQQSLADYFESNGDATLLIHWRRLPGFINKDYPEKHRVNIVKIVKNDLTVDQLIKEMEKNYKANTKHQKQTLEMLKRDDPKLAQQIEDILYSNEANKTLESFYDDFWGDKDVVNFQYILHLLRNGCDPQVVAYVLYEISPELEVRKPSDVQNYIQKTIDRALSISIEQRKY
mgnify:CR=1 FL=1